MLPLVFHNPSELAEQIECCHIFFRFTTYTAVIFVNRDGLWLVLAPQLSPLTLASRLSGCACSNQGTCCPAAYGFEQSGIQGGKRI